MDDNALAARVDALEAQLAALRHSIRVPARSVDTDGVPDTEQVAGPESSGSPVSDRRGVVKLLAATAVGAVAGTALNAHSAAATDGQPIMQGQDNNGTATTWIIAEDETAVACESHGGYGVGCWGPLGNAWFVPFTEPPHGYDLDADIGALWVDDDGNWWAATAAGSDAKWRKLAGPQTAGQLHLLTAPKRVYDSRPGEQPAIDPKSPLSPAIARTIDAKGNGSGVPAIAQGVLITLTVTGTGGPGFAAVWPSGTWPGTSTVNFTGANQTIATTTVVGTQNATFQIQSNTSTHVIVDVIGYYL